MTEQPKESVPFNIGDIIEELPYEGGAGSPDEFITNSVLVKALNQRNKELKPYLLTLGKRYLPSTDERFYINISTTSEYQYSKKVAELEVKLQELQNLIKAQKELERENGTARLTGRLSYTLSAKEMTKGVLDRIKIGNDGLHSGGYEL